MRIFAATESNYRFVIATKIVIKNEKVKILNFINIKFNFMSKKNQHVVPHGNQWAVKGEKNEKATKIVDTQTEAIKLARGIAINQKSEVVIHRPNGQIRDKDSYGNDDYPPKG